MPVTDITTDAENLTMTLVADVAAPVDRLWRAFTQPAQLERFWGPPGWPATFTRFDFTPGGRAQYAMSSPQGEKSRGTWEFIAIAEKSRFFESHHQRQIADLTDDLLTTVPPLYNYINGLSSS